MASHLTFALNEGVMNETISISQLNEPITVEDFRRFVKSSHLVGRDVAEIFGLSREETIDLLFLVDSQKEIQSQRIMHLYHLYRANPSLLPDIRFEREEMKAFQHSVIDIPTTRPARGGDMLDLKRVHQLKSDDFRHLFGISVNTTADTTSKGMQAPIKNPSMAILLRYFARYPSKMHRDREYSLEEVSKIVDRGLRETSILMGKQESSATRWTKGRTNMTPIVRNCSRAMIETVFDTGAITRWEELALIEGKARNVDDVLSEGHWNKARTYGEYYEKTQGG